MAENTPTETPAQRAERLERRHARWFGIGLVLIGLVCLSIAFICRDTSPVVGATLLGLIVGMLVGFFAQEAEKWTQLAMTASIGVLVSSGGMALLHYGAASDPRAVWFYPIGLVIGFGVGTIWVAADPVPPEKRNPSSR